MQDKAEHQRALRRQDQIKYSLPSDRCADTVVKGGFAIRRRKNKENVFCYKGERPCHFNPIGLLRFCSLQGDSIILSRCRGGFG